MATPSESEIEVLFAETLRGDYEDDAPWDAVCSLRRMGTRPVFEKAARWVQSREPLERARGIDILAQLGRTVEHPANAFPEESYAIVAKALSQERELQPLDSAIAALGHLDDARAIPLIVGFHSHPSAGIRFSVACALGSFADDELSIQTLLLLTHDADDSVRDWATFGLGVLGSHDSPPLRQALFERLADPNADVREEALVGLAKRHDVRALPVLLDALKKPEITDRIVEAAYTLLGFEKDRKDWSREDYANALRQHFES